MRFLLLVFFMLAGGVGFGQGTAPTFRYDANHRLVTLPGRDPSQGGTTVIPTVLVAVRLEFPARSASNTPWTLDAAKRSSAGTQFASVLKGGIRSGGSHPIRGCHVARYDGERSADWHTLLGQPRVRPVTVKIPAGYGYMLTSKRTGTRLGMADVEYVQRRSLS